MRQMEKLLSIGLASGVLAAPVFAQDHTHEPPMDHGAAAPMDHGAHADHDGAGGTPPVDGAPPPEALSGPARAADTLFDPRDMAAARAQLRHEVGGFTTGTMLADRFEIGAGDGEQHYEWDVQGRFGGDIHQLSWKSEGGGELGGNPHDVELQVLYSRAVAPFFDFQAGVRHDFRPSPRRSHFAVGVQGLLPYRVEVDAAAFVSEGGNVTGRFEVEHDVRLRQRLVLQPRLELRFAAQAVPEVGIGSGLGSVSGGLRLRYELRREIAPYVGVAWERKRGGTADFARAAGEDSRSWKAVVGLRGWF